MSNGNNQPGGIGAQAGETARKALDVFTGSPAFLAVVLLNLAVFGFVYFSLEHGRAAQRDVILRLLDSCVVSKTTNA